MRALVRIGLAVFAACALGCGGPESDATDERLAAVPIEHHECAVCGMLVRDQSAPRAQVLHRDGTRAFACSIGDLLAYRSAPSPHGAPTAVMVEVMDPGEDPMEIHTGEHPWIPADEAAYVVGIRRRGIMGEPVLVYADQAAAQAAATASAARVLDLEGLERWWLDGHEKAGASPEGAYR